MYNFIKKYLKPHIVPLNSIEISQKAIIANYRLWKKLQPSYKLISILKSNAYGHGIRSICQILNTIQHEVDMVGVDSLPEYQIVRDQTSFPILILNETNHHNYHYFDFRRTSLVVYTLDTIKFLGAMNESIKIHIFFNTGMNREGFQLQHLEQLATLLKQYPNLQIEGVMTHLSSAQFVQQDVTTSQTNRFKDMYATLKTLVMCNPTYIHVSNTCGMLSITDPLFNAGRLGLGLYGYTQLPPNHPQETRIKELQPALNIVSTITCIQELSPGETIGYDGTHQVSQYSKIGLIPFGYYEGLKRSACNGRICTFKDLQLPLVGLVSMNLSSIDLTGSEIGLHDSITLVSSDITKPNTIEMMAKKGNMSIYEILVGFHPGLRRVVIV